MALFRGRKASSIAFGFEHLGPQGEIGVLGGESNTADQGSPVVLLFFGEKKPPIGLKGQKLASLGLLGGTPNVGETVSAVYLNRCPECLPGLPHHEGRSGNDGNVQGQRMASTFFGAGKL